MGARRMWARINALPGDAGLWRALGRPDLVEVTDTWWRTFIKWRGGKPVHLPAPPISLVPNKSLGPARPANVLSIADFVGRNKRNRGR